MYEDSKVKDPDGYYVRPEGLPKEWICCIYCGHVFDPSKVKYEVRDLNLFHRQFLEGDCPKCGE